jgi:serine/threonine protein phosphatase PrpC
LLVNNCVFTANVGDSRAVLARKLSDKWVAIALSYD